MSTRPPQTPRLTIDIVSDVVCPWCVIGYETLAQTLRGMGLADTTEVRFHPFELNPHLAAGGQHLGEHLAQKYGSNSDQSRAARARLTSLGESLGFAFRFSDETRIYNTWRAHQLLFWARESAGLQKQLELQRLLFEAYFTEGRPIDDVPTLVEVAARAGLDAEEAGAVLYDARYADVVRAEAAEWRAKGISAVPSVIINGRSLLTGAQPEEVFRNAITRALATAASQETNEVSP
ncbi:MAG: DsbA family oxidoreductase [Sandaracinaceae bacterium]|jgi:predicted DsbA family dithiol-disulfide isomerase|nr:DsbA family oxidoreductase [Sandaracinaceae bacterium]